MIDAMKDLPLTKAMIEGRVTDASIAHRERRPFLWISLLFVVMAGLIISFFFMGGATFFSDGDDTPEVIECGGNLECVYAAAETCELASFANATTIEAFGFIMKITSYLEFEGLVDRLCRVHTGIVSITVDISPEMRQKAIDQGSTEEDIDAMIADMNTQMKSVVALDGRCLIPPADLARVLRESEEDHGTVWFDDYECSGPLFQQDIFGSQSQAGESELLPSETPEQSVPAGNIWGEGAPKTCSAISTCPEGYECNTAWPDDWPKIDVCVPQDWYTGLTDCVATAGLPGEMCPGICENCADSFRNCLQIGEPPNAAHKCVECASNSDCRQGMYCVGKQCVSPDCSTDFDCEASAVCNSVGICVL